MKVARHLYRNILKVLRGLHYRVGCIGGSRICSPSVMLLMQRPKFYLIGVLILSLTSGAAFTLVSSTLPYQLLQAGYSTDIVGAIFLAALPYSLKPLCAPFIDRYSIPVLCKKFGQRRGWALAVQVCLFLSTIGFVIIDPVKNIHLAALLAFVMSCCAAMQDIVLDAYRIERPTSQEELAMSATFSGIGFRLGMLISNIGALYISHIFSWYFVYLATTVLALIGPIVILYIEEPTPKGARSTTGHLISVADYFQTLQESARKLVENQPRFLLVMLFIALYKASDSIPMAMSSPLFIDLGFTSVEIASISKGYGLLLMIFGGFLGGILVSKLGIFRGVLICGSIQLLSPLMLMILAMSGHNLTIFIITITIQNFCCGLGGTAIVIYFSNLCNSKFVATQFAIISSFGSLVRITLSALAGISASYTEWPWFFLGNAILGMLFIVVFLRVYGNNM